MDGYLSQRKNQGFTLVELLVSLSVAVIFFGLAIPGIYSLLQSSKANSSIQQLMSIVQFARHTAVSKQQEITVCGSLDGVNCTNNWSGAHIIVFTDNNYNHRLDEAEELYLHEQLKNLQATISWKSSGNRKYLRYLPNGSVKEFGNFLYCPLDKNDRYARSLIISNTGRVRTAQDKNKDGYRENQKNTPLKCY